MKDLMIIAAVLLILGCAVFYIRKEKKKGVRCIGCPDGAGCSGKCSGCCGGCSGHCDGHSDGRCDGHCSGHAKA